MGDLLRRILEERPGRFVSGQEIGRRMGTSRAAVWKHVQALRRRGFGIEGARGAGYRLLGRPDDIEEEELVSRLVHPGFWDSFRYLDTTDSTNSRAIVLADQGSPHGTVVCADSQTGGRGRLGRRWESPPGVNLYVSLLLRPSIEPQMAPQLTLLTAVALARAVEAETGLRTGLKWPNDLYLGGRKAAGILAEMAADPDRLRHVVIGVGLNVNGREETFPAELRTRATSLAMEAGKVFRRVEVLARFLDAFAVAYGAFLSSRLLTLLPDWRRRDILAGKPVTLGRRGEEVNGTAAGVDDDGAFLFRRAGGRRAERIVSGEILGFGA